VAARKKATSAKTKARPARAAAPKAGRRGGAEAVRVGILVGSRSDLEVMENARAVLEGFGIGVELRVASAHRQPEKVRRYATEAAGRGVRVLIAGAGMAAHLAGALAAHSALPVIGVPLAASPLGGLDSLLSTAQMPAGVPVATTAIGSAGAKNAAHLAARILALGDAAIARRVQAYREEQARG
jgi:phosphoribosylaminoimidazole carboxylase PurE protein